MTKASLGNELDQLFVQIEEMKQHCVVQQIGDLKEPVKEKVTESVQIASEALDETLSKTKTII